MKSALVFLLASIAFAAPPDAFFHRADERASVSFEGVTPAGSEIHRLEVRRLAFLNAKSEPIPTTSSCVIYYAGDDYGPVILKVLSDCVSPVVRRESKELVEIYFVAGASIHIRQRWKLLGHTAELIDELPIEWHENPIHKKEK